MRAIWSGEIAFGLVTIPVKLYSGVRDLSPRFHLVHKDCGARVQMVRRCPKHQKDLAWSEIDKVFEVSKGEVARFSKEELAALEHEDATGTIDIVEFVDPHEVDPAYVETSYLVGPGGKSSNGFALLRAVLEKTGRAGVAEVAIRARRRLALLRPRERAFSLDMLRFADELVPTKDVEVPAARVPGAKELKLAQTLVDQLSAPFHPEEHPDAFRARVGKVVAEKVRKHQTQQASETESGGRASTKSGGAKILDLSELLERSLHARRAARPTRKAPRHAARRASGA